MGILKFLYYIGGQSQQKSKIQNLKLSEYQHDPASSGKFHI